MSAPGSFRIAKNACLMQRRKSVFAPQDEARVRDARSQSVNLDSTIANRPTPQPRIEMSCGAGLCQLWPDILVHTKEIGRIVFLLHRRQAWQIGTESGVNDLFGFNVERRKKMGVR